MKPKIDWEHEHKMLGCYDCSLADKSQLFLSACCSMTEEYDQDEETGQCLGWEDEWDLRCSRCGEKKNDIEERYSYGIYAGRLCVNCCSGYRDNCGLDQPQGDQRELEMMGEVIDEWE